MFIHTTLAPMCLVCASRNQLYLLVVFFNGKMETASNGSFFKSHVPCASQSLLWLIDKVHAESMGVVYTLLVSLFHPRPEFRVLGGVRLCGIKVHDIHFHSNDATMISDMYSSRERVFPHPVGRAPSHGWWLGRVCEFFTLAICAT